MIKVWNNMGEAIGTIEVLDPKMTLESINTYTL